MLKFYRKETDSNFTKKIDSFKRSAEKKLNEVITIKAYLINKIFKNQSLKSIINNVNNYKNEKEREKVISNCNTILNEEKKIEAFAKTDKSNNFAEFTLRKKLSESKLHKKHYSHYDSNNGLQNNKLIASQSNEHLLISRNNYNNKFESNKAFLENYTSYVNYINIIYLIFL